MKGDEYFQEVEVGNRKSAQEMRLSSIISFTMHVPLIMNDRIWCFAMISSFRGRDVISSLIVEMGVGRMEDLLDCMYLPLPDWLHFPSALPSGLAWFSAA